MEWYLDFARTVSPVFRQDFVHLSPGHSSILRQDYRPSFARTVSLRLTSCRIELTQSLLNYPALRDSLASSFLTNLRKQAFDVVSKWRSPNTCVEALWSRQESNLDLKFRKLLFYPLNYGTILKRVAKIIDNPVPPQNACGLAAINKTMYLSGSNL